MKRTNRNSLLIVAIVTLFATTTGASAEGTSATAASLPAGTMATVNGVALPQSMLDDAVTTAGQPDTPQLRQALKDSLIARELFRQSAEQAHYDARPEVQQAMQTAKVAAETQLYLKDRIRAEPVTDAQIKARYNEIVGSLGKDEYRARIITVADVATAATVNSELKAGRPFDLLARQYSIAPTREKGGELPWLSFRTPVVDGHTQGMPLAVAQAITTLPVGGITAEAIPVKVGNATQYVILKLDTKRSTQVPTLSQAKPVIEQQLKVLALQKAAARFTSDLMKAATIQQ
ncbi:peptidyl-prolyl cis-trans isomerase [Paraburkholderia sabiae]|uniref:peptidylprolyl isomerase n=1 Tax=Paraburkholderia sabiae TaxID=273251 RepID=A0ABU9QMS1_9BURK|nr:peptidyl-prolyl cis-trans isomerase [Paraburkholderia sabiae]WJZ77265.1 peptidyl-prolyl cis-trans isomerase [Paraburkholderia sabiae]CAD6514532.1 putative parvulin-type peptidyl-prolyl cis-trans isomerase [Paraburkholderia sabiae]